MPIHPVKDMIDGQPTFKKPLNEILAECKKGGAIKILDPIEYITERQRAWYKGVCIRDLVRWDENGETEEWWDIEIKSKCAGLTYLKKEIIMVEMKLGDEVQKIGIGRLTTKGVGKRNMSKFIEEILSQGMQRGWPVSEPDPDLRSK